MPVSDALGNIWTFSSSSIMIMLFREEVPLWFTGKEWTELYVWKYSPYKHFLYFSAVIQSFGVTVNWETDYAILGFAILTSVSRNKCRVSQSGILFS